MSTHRFDFNHNCFDARRRHSDYPYLYDPMKITELPEELGDDYEGTISFTFASSMDKPSLVITGEVPRDFEDHYRIVDERREDGLFRVVAIRTIVIDGYGIIEPGTLGGLIESEDNLEQGTYSWVGEGAIVTEEALVTSGALVMGGTFLTGEYEECTLKGDAVVADHALVFNSHLSGRASAEGNIEVYDSTLKGNTLAYGDRDGNRSTIVLGSVLEGTATIQGNPIVRRSHLKDKVTVSGTAHVEDSAIFGNVSVSDEARVSNSIIGGDSRIYDRAVVTDSTVQGGSIVCGDAELVSQLNVVDSIIG